MEPVNYDPLSTWYKWCRLVTDGRGPPTVGGLQYCLLIRGHPEQATGPALN